MGNAIEDYATVASTPIVWQRRRHKEPAPTRNKRIDIVARCDGAGALPVVPTMARSWMALAEQRT